ncbi:phosphoribosylanthranilate isomerase [Parapedobacter composti]|uniref:N-(5'-phosphoribosyl)anthranilate isomerase n=1 Tax=Parapedobacter composti TaxID=623281 RepID=A0A1I1LHJ7_9SPHI|nr:phosphoribosylanthranilate isomerase [Parapedobacter composti]SFC72002.1 phosphoribosylanthranilate isomerase [Parapedobacter composti]
MNLKIKICGLKHPGNIRDVVALQPDYIGFIFHPDSKRFVGGLDGAWVRRLDGTKKTGVFVNADAGQVNAAILQYGLAAVQLHGQETPAYCAALKGLGVEIIKAFGIDAQFDWAVVADYETVADYYLFDTKSPRHGGTGVRFDWGLLSGYGLNTPFFLSGGIGAENIREALHIADDRLYALDLNSRFETEPGVKDIGLLKQTLQSINDE